MKSFFVITFLMAYTAPVVACITCEHGTENVPMRSAYAPSGSSFIQSTYRLSEAARENAILRELTQGNWPEFMRQMTPVSFRAQTRSGSTVAVKIYVTPDYLSIGNDRDFVRVPMNPITAQRIADRFGLILPTTKIVDQIYLAASSKVAPAPLPPGKQMTTSRYYLHHHQKIENQRRRQLGALMAGHKKDVVISNRLFSRKGRVAIYGWHRPSGRPIQPLSLVHHSRYADYSHGVRLVSDRMEIDGESYRLSEVLTDPELAPVLSYEGPMRDTKYPLPTLSSIQPALSAQAVSPDSGPAW